MNIRTVTVMSIILTLTRYADGAKHKCRAIPFDTYFLEGETNLPQSLSDLSEIVYVPKRDAIYFRNAELNNKNYFNDTKIAMLNYSAVSLVRKINIDGALTFAYDDYKDIIYVGTNDGLYAVDYKHNIKETHITESVISVFVKNQIIYYINGYYEVIVSKFNKKPYKMDLLDIAKLKRLAVNSDSDMVGITKNLDIMTLSHYNGLNFHKSDKFGQPINLSVDNDIIYVYTTKGVYKMNSKGGLDHVSDFGNLQGLAFGNYNQFKKVDRTVITAKNGIITIRPRFNTNPCQG